MRVSHSAARSDTRLTKRPLGTKLGTAAAYALLQILWRCGYFEYMLTPSEFVAWLRELRSAGHSFTAIGRDLGVSRQAVQQWLSGATQPSRMALMLAEQLYHAPLDLAPGLPVAR